ncbi:MAG: DUF4189 domain-containing protein [Defluviicoccus sp.]|nr:DUF4189 domain-containing protein [Defluviicoccus sp.]MDE0277849.1 DUF4189 domain-containing protein [Defluviicoccus sp.]
MRHKAVFDRRRPFVKPLAAMIAATLLPAASPSHAQDAHGAIAIGWAAQEHTVAYGFAWNHAGRDEASQAALRACRAGGGTDCVEVAWFQNGCGALALDRHGMAQGKSAMSRERAEARALRTCEVAGGSGCTVVGSQCASPGGRAGTWTGSERVLAKQEEPRGQPAAGDAQRDEGLTRGERIRVQRGLAVLGFDAGPPDGMFGPRTRSAIWQWQEAKGFEATGYLTRDQAQALAAGGDTSRQGGEQARSRNRVIYFAAAGPKCPGMPEGSACWLEISNKPGCHLWTRAYDPALKFTWSGGCLGDTAHGRGTLHWSEGAQTIGRGTGEIVQGKQYGGWVDRYPRWGRLEHELRESWPEGQGVFVTEDGERYPGRWSGNCFRDRQGRSWIRWGPWKDCTSR